MAKKYVNLYGFINTVGDVVILNLAFIIGNYLPVGGFHNLYDQKYLQLWIYLNIIYLLAANFSKSTEVHRNTRFTIIINKLLQLFFFQVVLSFSYIVIFKDFNDTFKISREVLMWTFGIAAVSTTVWRLGFIKILFLCLCSAT